MHGQLADAWIAGLFGDFRQMFLRQRIVAQAGVAERTLYLNFPTKSTLLNEIIRVAVRGHDLDQPLAAGEGFRTVLEAPPGQVLPELAHTCGTPDRSLTNSR